MANIFNRPFNPVEEPGKRHFSILIFGLFIFLFLFLFKPFGMSGLAPRQQFFISLGFGLVTTFVLVIFKFLFEPAVVKKKWTLGKSILWDVIIASSIGVANYFYINLVFHQPFVFKYLFFGIWTAILVGSIPVTISYIVAFNRIYRDALIQAAISPDKVLWEDEITLHAGNPKNDLKVNPEDIVYLCSNDNYVTVVSMKGETINKVTLRGTLKSAEAELRNNKLFLRCHKCYIVNLKYVSGVKGNTQNLIIKLTISGTEIPVSRSKSDLVVKLTKRN
jgi:hypothetical protein